MQKKARDKKNLLDLLCAREQQTSRKEHYARILCGEIFVDGQCLRDPRTLVALTSTVEHRPRRYVSRGGEKLEGILYRWSIDVRGMSFIDAGASTGGFSDCLLQHGAARIIAVEAGTNQLDYRLRSDPRVTVLENTNIISVKTLPFVPEAAVADLSLRSLRGAAAHILGLVSEKWLIALLKPQYEWSNGKISDRPALQQAMWLLFQDLQEEGAHLWRLAGSALPGRKGNREFFCLLRADSEDQDLEDIIAGAVKPES